MRPADDELFRLVEQASAAMHSLAIHVHYAACEKQAEADAEVTATKPCRKAAAVGSISASV